MQNRYLRFTALLTLFAVFGCDKSVVVYSSSNGQVVAASGGASSTAGASTVSTTGAAAQIAAKLEESDGQLSAAEPDCAELRVTAARGFSCLHCLEPGAAAQARKLLEILKRSCLKNIAINYLVDGSFGFSEELLSEHLRILTAGGRKPTFVFYLTNGPSQRRWNSSPLNGVGTQIPPEEFRAGLFTDAVLQAKIRAVAARLVPVIDRAAALGARVILIPALEDNLTRRSFERLAELILAEIPPGLIVELGRNPCPSCFEGNDREIPSGVLAEIHQAGGKVTVKDGIVSNDGSPYSLTGAQGYLTLTALGDFMQRAAEKNNIFILWTARFQGLKTRNGRLANLRLPAGERRYPLPTAEESSALLEFLRSE